MRKLLTHSTYWALNYALLTALVVGVFFAGRWLSAALSAPAFAAVSVTAALLIVALGVRKTYRDPAEDERIRRVLGSFVRIGGAILVRLMSARVLLGVFIAAIAFVAWESVGDHVRAYDFTAVSALRVVVFLVLLALVGYLAGHESRDKQVAALRDARDAALAEVQQLQGDSAALSARLDAALDSSKLGELTRGDREAVVVPGGGVELDRADLMAASALFAAPNGAHA